MLEDQMTRTCVYLGLGGNQGNVVSSIQQAYELLSARDAVFDLRSSGFYNTSPVNVASGNWFVNSVCTFWTHYSSLELFKIIQEIEQQLGKVNKEKNADRSIDIDLLFYGSEVFNDGDLEIPHPRWKSRLFVLVPLAELTDQIVLKKGEDLECHRIQDLIEPLLAESKQTVSLLVSS